MALGQDQIKILKPLKITKMTTTDFTTALWVDQTPAEVFKAITNVRRWWSEEIEGNTAKLNDEFPYHCEDFHRCKMKLTEVVPDKKIGLALFGKPF
jgi:hypothetical protein